MQEEADGFAQSTDCRVITGTAGPGDALWMPPGWLFCDKSSGEVINGVRFTGMLVDSKNLLQTMKTNDAVFGWKDDAFAVAVDVQHLVVSHV